MMCQKCLNNFCIVRAKKSPLPLFGKRVKVSTGENSPFEKGGSRGDLGVDFSRCLNSTLILFICRRLFRLCPVIGG